MIRSCRLLKTAAFAVLWISAVFAQPAPLSAPSSVRFDIGALDKSADPCVDFYQYACGGWLKANPIPSDQAVWGRFDELMDRNRETLHQILEDAAKPSPGRDAV